MAQISFTSNLRRHVDCPEMNVAGGSLRDVLERAFADNPRLRGYVLDDQGALRKHMNVFVDGTMIVDRSKLSDVVDENSKVYVMQALSGG